MKKTKEGLNSFIKLCNSAQSEKILSEVFNLFLSTEERDDLAMRYLIIKELLKGEKSQREIAQKLEVSIAKITRGSNELKRFDAKFIKYIKEMILN